MGPNYVIWDGTYGPISHKSVYYMGTINMGPALQYRSQPYNAILWDLDIPLSCMSLPYVGTVLIFIMIHYVVTIFLFALDTTGETEVTKLS